MYGYATVSYNQTLDHLKFWPAITVVTTAVLKVKIAFRQTKVNWLLSEAIVKYRRLIVTHVRKFKRVHKLGLYLEVHSCVCVYIKIKPNYLYKGTLYRKMMQKEIKLSTKHPSETKSSFENSFLKSTIFSVKYRTFYYIPIKIEIFCNQKSIGLKYIADIWSACF